MKMRAKPHIYTEAERQFCIDHYNIDWKPKDIAAKFGVTGERLKQRVHYWRERGAEITKTKLPVGTVRVVKSQGRLVTNVKTENGWEYVKSEVVEKQAVLAKQKADKGIVKQHMKKRRKQAKKSTKPPLKPKSKMLPSKIVSSPTTKETDNDRKLQRKIKAERDMMKTKVPRTDLISLRISDRTIIMVPPEEMEAKKRKYGIAI